MDYAITGYRTRIQCYDHGAYWVSIIRKNIYVPIINSTFNYYGEFRGTFISPVNASGNFDISVGSCYARGRWTAHQKSSSLMEGDVTLNKCVSITDALYIAQYLAGLRSLTPEQLKAADTNDDGSVTITDALYIAKWLANPIFPLWDPVKDFDMLKPMTC